MKHKLIESIASQMNIPIADGSEWISQTVYSLAGQMGLASLWDHSDDKNTVSIQHFKDRMKQVFSTYANIYPELGNIIPKDKNAAIMPFRELAKTIKYMIINWITTGVPRMTVI